MMKDAKNEIEFRGANSEADAEFFNTERLAYSAPKLLVFGSVRELTRTGNGSGGDGGIAGMTMVSDPRLKENVQLVGRHPQLDIGLYLFDYLPEHRDACGHGRQFGVMADEVERVMPSAVSMHQNGYRQVNYAMLGIERR